VDPQEINEGDDSPGTHCLICRVAFLVAVPLGKSGREQEVAQSGQKEEGEMEKTGGDEKAHCA